MPVTVGNSSGMLKQKYVRSNSDNTDQYDTKLGPQMEADYEKTYAPGNSKDYDMRGWYQENGQSMGENTHTGHYTDKYKKPNHITFSNESKYSSPDNPGGVWLGNKDFMPSDQQINTPLKVKRLKKYMQDQERGQLLLPEGK